MGRTQTPVRASHPQTPRSLQRAPWWPFLELKFAAAAFPVIALLSQVVLVTVPSTVRAIDPFPATDNTRTLSLLSELPPALPTYISAFAKLVMDHACQSIRIAWQLLGVAG